MRLQDVIHGLPGIAVALMVIIPLAMTAAAVLLGWRAQRAAVARRSTPGSPRGPAEDALGAGITVAIVPFLFALLVLWARFF